MTGLEAYMRGLVDGGPTNSGHRTPTVIVEAPVNGIDGPNVAFNAWQFRQILARGGLHPVTLARRDLFREPLTVKELARRWYPDLMGNFTKQSSHLALDDIRDSIAELRYYRQYFFRLPDAD